MRSLKHSRQIKLSLLEQDRASKLLILASRKTALILTSKSSLVNTRALLEEKVSVAEAEIHKIDKKIARIKRKLKEKN